MRLSDQFRRDGSGRQTFSCRAKGSIVLELTRQLALDPASPGLSRSLVPTDRNHVVLRMDDAVDLSRQHFKAALLLGVVPARRRLVRSSFFRFEGLIRRP